MKYQIRFIKGGKQGEVFPLIPEQAISIGRSHVNTIRIPNPDVSGRHVMLRTDKNGNTVAEVLSSRITKHNGNNAKIGDMLEITDGTSVQMGDDTVFTVERFPDDNIPAESSDEEKTVFPPASHSADDNSQTVLDQTSLTVPPQMQANVPPAANFYEEDAEEPADANATEAFKTRAASDDELDNIKKAFRNKQRKKMLSIAVPIFLFFVLAVFLYFFLKPEKEEFVSWPTDQKGRFLNEYKMLEPYLAMVFPKVRGNTVKENGGVVEINSRIGKQLDVRLHIIAAKTKNPATLKQDHPAAFDQWMDKMREKEPTLTFGGDRTMMFLSTAYGSGIPLSCISYTRRVGNDDFWGYALFLRNAASIHSFMIEVPLSDRWRSEPFMRSQATVMVLYAARRVANHWEGTSSYRKTTDAAGDLQEAANFMEREAPVYWGRIFYLLRGALIKAALSKDTETRTEAEKMLVKLRKQQRIWYNTQKLAYQYAARNEDKVTMNSIQATGESVFSSEFQYSDFRYELIRRKDWK